MWLTVPREDHQAFHFSAPSLLHTPPLTLENSVAELHNLAGGRQFWSCLLALKSLVRFVSRIGITIHSDGTLTDKHATLFRDHFPGVRVIPKNFADDVVGLAL